MEEAAGTCLADVWTEMPLEQKLSIVEDLVEVQAKLAAMTLPSYGALVFCENSTESMEPWDRYTIGPTIDTEFHNDRLSKLDIAWGPCKIS